jgi:hypothetical protein
MASSSAHWWDAHESVGEHAWDAEQGDNESDTDEDPETNPHAAAAAFLDILVSMFMLSSISAQTFCTLCYWAAKAGMPGDVNTYSKKPGSPSGHYSRHLDDKLGFRDIKKRQYKLNVPGMGRHDIARTSIPVHLMVPHECIDRELKSDVTIRIRCQEMAEAREFPPSYFDNPVVVTHGAGAVLPLGMFMDGVPYSLTDAVVGIWLFNLVTGTRHLIGLIRKSVVCQCGCRGSDTWFPILLFLRWSFR